MTDKINTKTNIVERRHVYNKIVNVKTATELKKKYGLLEHGLGKCLKVFFGKDFKGGSRKSELKVHEVKNGKKRISEIDLISKFRIQDNNVRRYHHIEPIQENF